LESGCSIPSVRSYVSWQKRLIGLQELITWMASVRQVIRASMITIKAILLAYFINLEGKTI